MLLFVCLQLLRDDEVIYSRKNNYEDKKKEGTNKVHLQCYLCILLVTISLFQSKYNICTGDKWNEVWYRRRN